MKKTAALFATLVVAACAQTPIEVRQTGTRIDRSVSGDSQTLARCMQKNAENWSGTVRADVRPLAGGAQVVMRMDDGTWTSPGTIALYELQPGKLLGYVQPSAFWNHDALTNTFLKGC